ncbi:hypothetical protein KJ673_00465 [Patescibacteria group bacterium]|nr:hypothetical protein [Patescibacteria group bacterium]MCG2688007.1 hypothetical protein [Candidatus Parcubacteria bacterium]
MQEFYQMSPSDTSISVTCQLPNTEEHPIHSGTTDHTLLPPSVVPWTSRTPEHRVALARAMSIKDRLAEHGMGFDDDDVKKVFVKKSASQIVDHLAGMLNGLCPQACDQRKKIFHMAIEIEMTLGDLIDFAHLTRADSVNAMVDSVARACALRADPGASDQVVEIFHKAIEIEMTLGDLIDFAHLVRADSVNAMVDSVARACALRADPGASNRLQTIFRDTARMTVCNPVILTNMVRSASFGQMCSTIPSGLRQAVGLDVVHAANAYAKPVAPPPVVEKIEMDPWGRAKRIASAICNLDALGGIEIVVD